MNIQITPLKTAAVAAVIGLSPALVAQSSMNSQQSNQQQQNSRSAQQQQSQPYSQSQQAREQSQHTTGTHASTRAQTVRAAGEDPRGHQVSNLKGWEVKSQGDEKLGDLSDFIVDTQSGKIVYAVIGSGGVLGIGETLRAVPFKALRQGAAGEEEMILNIDQAKWSQAPVFKKDQIAALGQDQRRQQIFQHYGQTEDSQRSMQRPGQAQGQQGQQQSQRASQGAQQLALASDIIGRDIRSGQQEVGEVEDIIVQFRNRTAAALIDPEDDFAGTDQNYIVPLNKLTIAGDDALTTTLTRQDFAGARPTQDDSWSNESTGYVSTLYVWPMHNAGLNQQAGAQTRSQDMDRRQTQTSSDSQQKQAPIAAVRQAIQAEGGQSNINVTTSGDKLVLSGTVQSEDIKDRIEDRAERAADGWDIDNQIRVAQQDE